MSVFILLLHFLRFVVCCAYRLLFHHLIRWLIHRQMRFISIHRTIFFLCHPQSLSHLARVLNTPKRLDAIGEATADVWRKMLHFYYLWLLFHTLIRLTNAIIITYFVPYSLWIPCVLFFVCLPIWKFFFLWCNQTLLFYKYLFSCRNKSMHSWHSLEISLNSHCIISFNQLKLQTNRKVASQNLLEEEKKERNLRIFRVIFFIHFWNLLVPFHEFSYY